MSTNHKNPELVVGKKYKLLNTMDSESKHLINEIFTVIDEDFNTDLKFLDKTVWFVSLFQDTFISVDETNPLEVLQKHTPILLDSENVVAFDCDDTLVMWDTKINNVYVTCPYTNRQEALARHEVHIQELKKNKAKGNKTVVWSAGGVKWAEAVVKALGIEEYVDLIMVKPNKFFDDLPAEQVLVNRVYIPFKEKE